MDSFLPLPSFAGHGLGCIRGGRAVFAGLDFSLIPGGAVVLLGPNGSGKSTLLRVMAGLLKPTAGRLGWDDGDIGADADRHHVRTHYVGHHDAIKPVLSVAENLGFWARLHDPATAAARVAAAMDRFGLAHLAAIPGKMLSAGQKRRANLARLLAAPSPLWLLDEPTTALDRATIAQLEQVLADHRARGGMAVVSTHQDIALPGAATLHLDHFGVDAVDDCDDMDDGGEQA